MTDDLPNNPALLPAGLRDLLPPDAETEASAVEALNDPATTPSARVLEAMARDHGNTYVHFVLAQSLAHREALLKLPFSADVAARFAKLAEHSLARQHDIEATDTLPFDTFLQRYLSPTSLNV